MKTILKGILLAAALIFSNGCAKAVPNTIPPGHPAYKFHSVAVHQPVVRGFCAELGGTTNIPTDALAGKGEYERVKAMAEGAFLVRHKPTGRSYLLVSYLEDAGAMTVPRACSWEQK